MTDPEPHPNRRWPHALWAWVHEPRLWSTGIATVYTLAATAGIATLLTPVRSIEGQIGSTMTIIWGALLAFGGVLGVPAALRGWWDFERAALLACATGLAIYISTVWILVFTSTGNRVTQGALLIALGVVCGLRYHAIRGARRDYRTD